MASYSYGGRSRYSHEATVARIERSLASEGLEIALALDRAADPQERFDSGIGFYTLLAAGMARETDEAEAVVHCIITVTEEVDGVFVEVRVPDRTEYDGNVHLVPISDGIGARLRHAIAPLLSHRGRRV